MLSSRELPARTVAVAVAAVVVLALAVAGAFAFGLLGGEPTILDQVPDDADTVVRIDPAILDDPASESLFASGVAAAGFGPTSADDALGEFEATTGLSPAGMEDVVAFSRFDATGDVDVRYVGVVVHADWDPEQVRHALSQLMDMEYAAETYEEHTVYQPADDVTAVAPSVAVLEEGEYVVGSPLTVEDAIAVRKGHADALGGPVRNALSSTDEGLVTVATTLPRERVANFDARTGGLTRLSSLRTVAGSYSTSGETISLGARLRTNGTEAARDVTDVARGGLAVVASDVDNGTVADTLRDVTVEREGRDVTLRVELTETELDSIARYYGLVGT